MIAVACLLLVLLLFVTGSARRDTEKSRTHSPASALHRGKTSSPIAKEYPRAQSHSSVIAVRRPRRPGCGSAVGNILRGWCRNRHHWGRIRPWRVVILCVSAWSRRPVSPLRCGTPSWYGLGTPRRDTFRAEYRKSVPTSMRCNRWTANNRSGTASWRISFRRAKPFPITMITVN